MTLKLGSLFDGAGGFPLAGVLAGFTPIWASEIEPFPIRVTTRRFPYMKHLGDIRRISGAEIEPVDVITFGSPCQDLSVANGTRKGLEGARSGLFREAIRIIREMREATHGSSPTFIIWENVPGAFSSNKGADFREVLEEIAQTADPEVSIRRPENGKWPKAGECVGDGWSIAYRTYDAQYWGVPQRRRRIYLVADFGGQRAGSIQFERESLYGHIAESGTARERPAGTIEDSSDATGGGDRIAPQDVQAAAFIAGQGAAARGIGWSDTVSPTLKAEAGGNTVPCVICLDIARTLTAGFNGHAGAKTSICYKKEQSPCITTRMPPNVIEAIENHPNDSRIKLSGNVVQTLSSRMGTGGNNEPMVLCIQGNTIERSENAGANGKGVNENISYTLNTADRHAVAYCLDRASYNQGKNAQYDISVQEEKAQTLVAKGPPAVCEKCNSLQYRVRRITPLECSRLQGFPDYWVSGLNITNIHEKYIQRWKSKDIRVPKSVRKKLNKWIAIFEQHRRITAPDIRPKTRNQVMKWLKDPHSNSAEYKMWGNSLALPCAYTVLAGIADELLKRERKPHE